MNSVCSAGSCSAAIAASTAAFYRDFGSPHAQFLAQAQGDTPPVQMRSVDPRTGETTMRPAFVNYRPLEGAVTGRALMCGGPNRYIDDAAAGFSPSLAHGIVAAPPRVEDVVGTRSHRGPGERGSEFLATRALRPTERLSNLSLMPQSERSHERNENKDRINFLHEAYVLARYEHAAQYNAAF